MLRFQKHVFICTNERAAGSSRPSCGEAHGMALVRLFKQLIKEKKLDIPVRAQRAGCLDACETGPTVVVYPDGVYYGHVTEADVAEIVESHIVHGRPVDRLLVKPDSHAG